MRLLFFSNPLKKLNFFMPKHLILFLISLPFLILAVLIIIAPLTIPPGTITDLSGTVGTIENQEQFDGLPAIPRLTYLFGDIECHQIASRSYFLNENQMPVCSRDLGLFLGIPAGFLLASYRRIIVTPIYLIPGLAPLAIDGTLQMLTSYESTNIVRLITGLIAGLFAALVISTLLHEIVEIREMKRQRKATSQETANQKKNESN